MPQQRQRGANYPVPSIGLGLLAEKEHKQRQAIFDWEKHWQRWLDLYRGWLTARESRDIESASRVAAGKAPADTFEKRALTVADRIVAAIENVTQPNPRFQKDNVARYKQLRKYTGTYHHDMPHYTEHKKYCDHCTAVDNGDYDRRCAEGMALLRQEQEIKL